MKLSIAGRCRYGPSSKSREAFKFDFVELYRVSGVHIEPLSAVQPTVPGHKSSWNVDGEVAHGTFIASAKRGLVDVFARGPDLTHQRSR